MPYMHEVLLFYKNGYELLSFTLVSPKWEEGGREGVMYYSPAPDSREHAELFLAL